MNFVLRLALALFFLAVLAAPAMAQGAAQNPAMPIGYGLAALGAGVVMVGGGLGIGKLAAAAMEGTARQPEAGGSIFTAMIISAALIEGATLFGLVICYFVVSK